MVLTIARFLNLFLVAVLAGLLVGILPVERPLVVMGPSVYTAVQKPKHEIYALMRLLIGGVGFRRPLAFAGLQAPVLAPDPAERAAEEVDPVGCCRAISSRASYFVSRGVGPVRR